ncbi:MAG TPA: hypothetical protein DDW42_09525 [Desulfobacteraceae bacterium]|nr:hypothetical protein [Desulfobacteraceae bacterium]
MKILRRDLQSIVKSLKALTQKTEKIAANLAKIEKYQVQKVSKEKASAVKRPARKTTAKKTTLKRTAAKKAIGVSATDTVLAIINRNKKGLNTTAIKNRTGFNDKKIWNIINRLKKGGKIKSSGRGIYLKA